MPIQYAVGNSFEASIGTDGPLTLPIAAISQMQKRKRESSAVPVVGPACYCPLELEGRRLCTIETQTNQVHLFDENVHDPNRVVFCNEVTQALRQQRGLLSVLTFDVSRQIDPRVQYVCELYRVRPRAVRGFSHDLQRLLAARL